MFAHVILACCDQPCLIKTNRATCDVFQLYYFGELCWFDQRCQQASCWSLVKKLILPKLFRLSPWWTFPTRALKIFSFLVWNGMLKDIHLHQANVCQQNLNKKDGKKALPDRLTFYHFYNIWECINDINK